MKIDDRFMVDKTSRLSGYHLTQVDIPCPGSGYHLLLPLSRKEKISLPGSDSETLCKMPSWLSKLLNTERMKQKLENRNNK